MKKPTKKSSLPATPPSSPALRPCIIGTAGHIDHGKSRLVEALTGIKTDRLPEEQERGISIDLGFAPLTLAGTHFGIVDVPGHERFIKNMVAGAHGVDMVVLVIDIKAGIQPQTREHLQICSLLGIRHGLVVLSKIDLLSTTERPTLISKRSDEIRQLLTGTTLSDAQIFPVSATDNLGLDPLKAAITAMAKESDLQNAMQARSNRPFRMYVDRVFAKAGFGTVVTGTVHHGQCKVGDPLMVVPGYVNTAVRKIESFLKEVPQGLPGMRLALNLQHADQDELARGHCLLAAGPTTSQENIRICDELIVHLLPVETAAARAQLKHNSWMRLHWGTDESHGRLLLRGFENSSLARLKLENKIYVKMGDRLILRSQTPVMTVAGAQVLVPLDQQLFGHSRWSTGELQLLQTAIATNSDVDVTTALVAAVQRAGKKGCSFIELASFFDMPVKQVALYLEEELLQGRLLSLATHANDPGASRVIAAAEFKRIQEQLLLELQQYSLKNSADPVCPQETLRNKVSKSMDQELFKRVLMQLVAEKQLQLTKDGGVKLKGIEAATVPAKKTKKTATASPKTAPLPIAEMPERILQIVQKASMTPPNMGEIAALTNIPPTMASSFVKSLLRDGAIVRLPGDFFMDQQVVEQLVEKLKTHFKQQPALTLADFKAMLGLSRKYLVPLIEYLDQEKYTFRAPDNSRKPGTRLQL